MFSIAVRNVDVVSCDVAKISNISIIAISNLLKQRYTLHKHAYSNI